jgi:RND family efflux transporter MFP subunit
MSKSIVLLVVALIATSCSRPDKIEARSDPVKNVTVAVVKATGADLSRDMLLMAEFRPYQEIDVHAKVAGYLKQIYVDVGDRVKAGQLLAVLEVPELADELQQAAASRKRSDAEVTRTREELHRSESAHEATHLSYNRLASVIKLRPNLVAQQEIDEALARDRVSEAQLSAAKATISAAEQQVLVSKASEQKIRTLLDYTRITAPFSGVITKRYADTGAMIQAGTASQTQSMPVVRLSENDRLRLVLPVPESVVPRIRIGAPVEVRVRSLNQSFQGRVSRFSGKVQSSTRTMETEVDVPNSRLVMMPGMYAEAALTLEQREDALAIPVQAVNAHETAPTVFVVNGDNRVEERPVKLGIETPAKVEVISGLKENELVVVGNRNQLKPGQKVQPKLVHLAEANKEG